MRIAGVSHRSWWMSAVGLAVFVLAVATAPAQQSVTETRDPKQAQDEEFAKLYKEWTGNPIYGSPLVDHLPKVPGIPTPKDVLGYHIGAPGKLTYYEDILKYYRALAAATPRVRIESIGKSDEGRELVVVWVSSDANIKGLQGNRDNLAKLADPRGLSEPQIKNLIATTKPHYHLMGGLHSGELGPPEMLMELVYRLAVETSPLISQIRNNVITFITPVVEVDGRERIVDTYYYNAKRAAEGLTGQLGLPYWGKYVAHDNNRDGMGQFLSMTKNVMKVATEWKPTVLHDLHEQAQLLYASTGTGPYNEQLDPITIGEWWMFAQNDVMEMTKRGVPGVWTYGFYDGWTPNYMFYAVHTHNATGRFYEVGGYNVGNPTTYPGAPAVPPGASAAAAVAAPGAGRGARGAGPGAAPAGAPQAGRGGRGNSREWFRPNPAREHEPVGRAVCAELYRQGQRAVARELLDQEQERRGEGHQRSLVRLGRSCHANEQGQRR